MDNPSVLIWGVIFGSIGLGFFVYGKKQKAKEINLNKKIFLSTALMTLFIFSIGYTEDLDIANLFNKINLNGTIIISSLDGTKTYIHNDKLANERILPASTFKIPNTLIALEEGVIVDGKEIIKWDGKDRGMPAWNKDQSIETAFPSSCVWFYQELAKRIGIDKYKFYLNKMKYGNEQTGNDVTSFWLDGDLKINAVEQVKFLKKIYLREFDFKSSSYELLSKIMIVDKTPVYTLRVKTGWASKISPPVCWFIGYVQSGGNVWFFATDIEVSNYEDIHYRQEITIDALKVKGII